MKIDTKAIIEAYNNGQSMNSIAKAFGTYTMTIKRILEKNHVELRHDSKKEGKLYVKDGEKLLEWCKAQGRQVTRDELAKVIGRSKLSPSYFIKYPELGQYVKSRDRKELQEYTKILYDWLKKNDIPYKPNDRTKLNVSVDALLLEDYSNIAIQISERPRFVSTKKHEETMKLKYARAKEVGVTIIFLDETSFRDLDRIKTLLNDLKS